MTTPPTLMRRLLGATVSLGLAAGGLFASVTVAASPASAIAGEETCTATMSPTSIRPGESATLTVTASDGFPAILMVNGHVVPNATSGWSTGATTQDYSWWSGFGTYAGVLAPTSAGYRIYSGSTTMMSVTDTTPFLCEAQVTLLPAAQDQTITFTGPAATPLSAGTVTAVATASSGLPVTYGSTNTSVCTVNPTSGVVTLVAQGECQLTANQAGNSDYNAAPAVYQDFYVQVPQSITFAPVADQTIGAGPITLAVSLDSGRFVTVVSNTPQICAVHENQPQAAGRIQKTSGYAPPTVDLLAVGTCSVTASRGASGSWLAAPSVTRTFKIKPVFTPGTLTLAAPQGAPLSSGSVSVRATSTAAGAIGLSSATSSVCTVSGTKVKLRKAGICTVRATQSGASAVTASIRVWATPALPKKGKATTVVTVLGTGEGALKVTAKPSAVCRVTSGRVLLVSGGTCTVRVARGTTTVRQGTVKVAYPKASKPSDQLDLAGTAYFAFNSAVLTPKAAKALRSLAPTLKQAKLVVVYGNTFGPGKNSQHSRKLSAARANVVVAYLAKLGVKATAVKVAVAMQNPVSTKAAKNRRVDIYVIKAAVTKSVVS